MRYNVVLLALTIACSGCGLISMISQPADEGRMLPGGFPTICRTDMQQINNNTFWILDYDTDGDTEADVRVWYFVKESRYDESTEKVRIQIAQNPHRVERLSMGFFPTEAKVDYEMQGKVQEVQKDQNGKWVVAKLR